MIATVGGGLCQLSNALYEAAVDAGLEVVERHAHTRIVPGSRAAAGRDATVFWNYLDFRVRSRNAFRIDATLTTDALDVTVRGFGSAAPATTPDLLAGMSAHDCLSCGQISCHRHDPDTEHVGAPTAWLVDASTPEFAALYRERASEADLLMLPSRRIGRHAGGWPMVAPERTADLAVLQRSFALRTAAKGKPRAASLLAADARLAKAMRTGSTRSIRTWSSHSRCSRICGGSAHCAGGVSRYCSTGYQSMRCTTCSTPRRIGIPIALRSAISAHLPDCTIRTRGAGRGGAADHSAPCRRRLLPARSCRTDRLEAPTTARRAARRQDVPVRRPGAGAQGHPCHARSNDGARRQACDRAPGRRPSRLLGRFGRPTANRRARPFGGRHFAGVGRANPRTLSERWGLVCPSSRAPHCGLPPQPGLTLVPADTRPHCGKLFNTRWTARRPKPQTPLPNGGKSRRRTANPYFHPRFRPGASAVGRKPLLLRSHALFAPFPLCPRR